ncbi:unnamed protein product [Rotaria socialis]|uniref:B box-type domain-containing protein n=1 Tax=Rotaria socialis TaxID=392032 RepID=A0A818APP8_9BILA|nr:unnamed protein product [Rotaria socialis]CAF3409945.1 unnamed protein product [Rotaria socialis]CAF4414008.1 unnamed protein product [Rotaria socialis]CAF4524585.1 unnamed protein product [Rotaria socialis]
MASSNCCFTCRKSDGTCFCPGCKAYFCDDDFISHRGMLINDLDGLTVDRNDLQEKINEAVSNIRSGQHITAKIDEWERRTTEKVKQAAELAKKHVLKIINSKQHEITKRFDNLSQELKERRVKKSVVEQDIARLRQEIDQLKTDTTKLAQTTTIELNMKQSDEIKWDHMICVEEKSIHVDYQLPQLEPTVSTGQHNYINTYSIVM